MLRSSIPRKVSSFVSRRLPRAYLSVMTTEPKRGSQRTLPPLISSKEKYNGSVSSLWWEMSAEERVPYPRLDAGESVTVNTAIVGGGLFGLLQAEALASVEPGLKIAVLEMQQIGQGVAGRSTAKVTALHQDKYRKINHSFGQTMATAFAALNVAGVEQIRRLIQKYDIKCDYEKKNQVIFADIPESAESMKEEFDAALTAGLSVTWTDALGGELPFSTYGAIHLADQFQVNPVALNRGLARGIKSQGNGCMIFENSRVEHFSEGFFGNHRLVLANGAEVLAENIIFATQLPFADRGMHFASVIPSRSYCSAYEIQKSEQNTSAMNGMYINFQDSTNTRSIRTACDGKVMIFSGAGHVQGDPPGGNTQTSYLTIQEYAEKNWGDRLKGPSPISNWSAHDFYPADSLPYIGYLHPATRSLFTATGFAKWGFSQAAGASLVIQDLILNPGQEKAIDIPGNTFKATRFDPLHSVKGVAEEQMHVAKHFVDVKSKLGITTRDLGELDPGEGSLVKINRRLIGAYRDENSDLHLVKPVCTHLGCNLCWNQAERTWDCGCHGSRFSYSGTVISGPANKNLETIKAPEIGKAATAPA
jgi:glycine/D-amino acid oxidase-like deaminating enzyme/nitrite reductase/ring-hydroxylating ferredoxin subunit